MQEINILVRVYLSSRTRIAIVKYIRSLHILRTDRTQIVLLLRSEEIVRCTAIRYLLTALRIQYKEAVISSLLHVIAILSVREISSWLLH